MEKCGLPLSLLKTNKYLRLNKGCFKSAAFVFEEGLLNDRKKIQFVQHNSPNQYKVNNSLTIEWAFFIYPKTNDMLKRGWEQNKIVVGFNKKLFKNNFGNCISW